MVVDLEFAWVRSGEEFLSCIRVLRDWIAGAGSLPLDSFALVCARERVHKTLARAVTIIGEEPSGGFEFDLLVCVTSGIGEGCPLGLGKG